MLQSEAHHLHRPFTRRRLKGGPQGREDIDQRERLEAPALVLVHGSSCICHICNRGRESDLLAA